MLEEIRTEFPLKAVSEGEETMAIGDLSLDPDTMKELFGTSDFEKINSIHNVQYSLFTIDGDPIFIYHSPLEVVANNYRLGADLLKKIIEAKMIKVLKKFFIIYPP